MYVALTLPVFPAGSSLQIPRVARHRRLHVDMIVVCPSEWADWLLILRGRLSFLPLAPSRVHDLDLSLNFHVLCRILRFLSDLVVLSQGGASAKDL